LWVFFTSIVENHCLIASNKSWCNVATILYSSLRAACSYLIVLSVALSVVITVSE
jgi:hypothetical protein